MVGFDDDGRKDAPGRDPDESEEELPSGLARLLGGSRKDTARYAEAAYGLVGGLLGVGFIGWLLDRQFGTGHRWLLVGMLLGGGVGFYRLGLAMLGRR